MSAVPPAFDWSKRLEYNWYSVEDLEKLRRLVGPSLPYEPDEFQLGCTARIVNGQNVLCVSATGDGKSAFCIHCTKRYNYTGSVPYEVRLNEIVI